MNDTENETVKFSAKPNPFFYALEGTLYALLVGGAAGAGSSVPALWLEGGLLATVVFLLITMSALAFLFFMVLFIVAYRLTFIVTDKRAIVRFSFRRTTTDLFSIAIETVKHIEINSYGATYGSVYLAYDKTSFWEISKDGEPDGPQVAPIRRARDEATRASTPIKRTASILAATNNLWPRWRGFYGFKGFEEFANIISEQA